MTLPSTRPIILRNIVPPDLVVGGCVMQHDLDKLGIRPEIIIPNIWAYYLNGNALYLLEEDDEKQVWRSSGGTENREEKGQTVLTILK